MFRCLDVDVKAWCCHGNNWSRNYILIFSFMGWLKLWGKKTHPGEKTHFQKVL
uniref:Uncharacterized protein n=1 Tax=Anguilla anguilla TaxID=7936 RepID=A0A0E9U382_ANGAN